MTKVLFLFRTFCTWKVCLINFHRVASLTPKRRSKVRKTDVKMCWPNKGQRCLGRMGCWSCSLQGCRCMGWLRTRCSLATPLTFRANKTGHPQSLPGKHTGKLMKADLRPPSSPSAPKPQGRQAAVGVLMGCCTSTHRKVWGDTCSSVSLSSPLLRGVDDFQLRCIANVPQQSHWHQWDFCSKMQFEMTKGQKIWLWSVSVLAIIAVLMAAG